MLGHGDRESSNVPRFYRIIGTTIRNHRKCQFCKENGMQNDVDIRDERLK